MARINTNVAALVAQRNLAHSFRQLNTTLEHLSTGLRISHGKDDPAGLIVSERLRSEIGAVGQAVSNTQRAKVIVATTDGALDEVSALLKDIQGKIVEAANAGAMSDDELKANQLQIDSAIDSITRIANTTSFAGQMLLDGSLQYNTSGVSPTAIAAYQIHGTQFGSLHSVPVQLKVASAAHHGQLPFAFGAVTSNVTIEVRGRQGVTSLSFGAGTTASQIVQAITSVSDATGVSATLSTRPTSGFVLTSRGYGSREFVSVKVLGNGTFNGAGEKHGTDAVATINGTRADADGNHLAVKTATLDLELDLMANWKNTTSFSITGGGALFQVGPHVNTNLQVNIGVQSVAASNLGRADTGYLAQIKTGADHSVAGRDFATASRIVDEAIRQVAVLRGRLGAFERNTLDTNANQLGVTMENLMSAESSIRDADFAYETSQLARNQILVNAGTTVLTLANQSTQAVLKLLGG